MRAVIFAGLAALAAGAAQAADLPAPLTDADFMAVDSAEARLGQLLFFDPILSGNRSVACATCHHPRFAGTDGLSLGIGDDGIGIGPERVADPANLPEQRIPRNAPALFNLGTKDVRLMFHDGRIETDRRSRWPGTSARPRRSRAGCRWSGSGCAQ